jgi:hypothetical protein
LEIVEPFNNTRVARRETVFDDRFSFLWPAANIMLEGVSSQPHNLRVGLQRVCFATKLCDKSRAADDDASTKLGELETNLTERSHRLMRAISEA